MGLDAAREIGLLAAVVVLTVELVAVWEIVLGAKWIIDL